MFFFFLFGSAFATLLRNYQFITAHDAATSYLEPSFLNRFAKTQKNSIREMLDCGTRVFDMRPKIHGNLVIFHHGIVDIEVTLATFLGDLRGWTKSKPNTNKNLVLIYISHCHGHSCQERVNQILEEHLVPPLTNCELLTNLTVEEARDLGRRNQSWTGASILPIFGCTEENYDSEIQCFSSLLDTCYKNSSRAITNFKKYVFETVTRVPPTNRLKMVQLHWQESTFSVLMDLIHDSSLIWDEKQSHLNQIGIEYLKEIDNPSQNLLEFNNVCNR